MLHVAAYNYVTRTMITQTSIFRSMNSQSLWGHVYAEIENDKPVISAVEIRTHTLSSLVTSLVNRGEISERGTA